MRDAKIKAIGDLAVSSVEDMEVFEQQAKELLESYPDHLPVKQMHLNKHRDWAGKFSPLLLSLCWCSSVRFIKHAMGVYAYGTEKDKDLDKSPAQARWDDVVKAADAIIDSIDQQDLARTIGVC